MKVPFVTFKPLEKELDQKLRNAFERVYSSSWYIEGKEDEAFEKRMSGKTPDLPLLGGEAIGHVLIKAISNSIERFQNADEFINALKLAVEDTSPELLNEKINVKRDFSSKNTEESVNMQYGITIGEIEQHTVFEENIENECNNSLNKHLFESIGEISYTDVPKMETLKNSKDKIEKYKRKKC